MVPAEPVLYSVWIRRGPDIRKYDLIFEENGITLRFLGEHWLSLRPRTGLQRQADLLIYSIKKKRARQDNSLGTVHIDYCDIVRYELRKPMRPRNDAPKKPGIKEDAAKLTLVLRDGRIMEIEFSAKVYQLAKLLVKNYLIKGLEACYKRSNRRR